MNIKAWEVQEDGSLEPVTVVGRGLWPGTLRIEKDGGQTFVNRWALVSHKTGERLTHAEVMAS